MLIGHILKVLFLSIFHLFALFLKTDVEITSIAVTTSQEYQTAAYVDTLGRIYTVGYNGNGEMGDDSTTTTTEPTNISEASLKVNRKIFSKPLAINISP